MRRHAMYERWFALLVFGLTTLASLQASATVLRRLTNVHGSACQTSDPETQHAQYSDTGMLVKVPSTPSPPPVSVACTVPWAQDQSLLATQKITVTLDWNSAPISTVATFNPSCMFYLLTSNGGELWYGLTLVNNPGTATPEYVFVAQATTTLPLPIYGTIVGSALYCNNVPVGVGITGYTVETCFATSLGSGC
ncbi:MAG TPA: hypothetical protein VFH68_22580 [Polyangia bacterium]|jgi:hypothetical protein|nr:hypothetical protein [Polyangia bacterium]